MKILTGRFAAGIAAALICAAPFAAGALSIDDIQAQIAALLKQVSTLQEQIKLLQNTQTTPPTDGVWIPKYRICQLLNRNLGVGVAGDDVSGLQEFLQGEGFFTGTATGYYGPVTANAVAKWQASQGVTAAGSFGPLSRERLRIWCGGNPTPNQERFSASPTSGRSPLSVTFSTWLSGFHVNTISYSIDYGDGTSERAADCYAPADACISAGTNTHTYTSNGVYTATLNKITNTCPAGAQCFAAPVSQVVAKQRITVGDVSTSDSFGASPTSGSAPLNVYFKTSVQLPSPLIADASQYKILFGDGQEQALSCISPERATDAIQGIAFPSSNCYAPAVSHTYTASGTYTASLVRYGGFCAGQCPVTTVGTVQIVVGGSTQCGPIAYSPVACADGSQPQPVQNANGCTIRYECPVTNFTPPASCKTWNDGCNTCSRTSPGSPAACTLRYCFAAGKGYCSAYFDDTTNTNRPPVISGFSGPTSLSLNQTGTWTVNASDPENGTLSYHITWGDEQIFAYPTDSATGNALAVVQNTTFTHAYSSIGTYTVTVVVTDSAGQQAKTSSTVRVGGDNVVCTAEYAPVCGQPPEPACRHTPPYCAIATPGPTTYSNRCAMNAAGATLIYVGACTTGINDIPLSVSQQYNATASTYGQSLGATLKACTKGSDKVYVVSGSGGFTGVTYYFSVNGTLLGTVSFSDVIIPGQPENRPPVDVAQYSCVTLQQTSTVY